MNPDDTLQASEEVEVEGEEAIPARGLPSPTQPTRKEIQEHVLTHLPPRSWCGHCPRGTSLPHFRNKTEGERVVPTVSIDYFFMGPSGQEEAQGVLPMLAVKSHESRMTFAHVRCRRHHDLRDSCGCWHRDCHIRGKCISCHLEEHQSNGTIEVTVREIQKQVRVMKSALEERMKGEVPSRHPILAFFVEHAERLMLRYQVGRDGRTAYELHAGEPYRSWLNLENECTSCQFDLEMQDKRNWIPSGKMEHSPASEIAVTRC